MQNYAGKLTCTGKHYCDIYMMIYYNMEMFPKWLCVDPRTNCVHIR